VSTQLNDAAVLLPAKMKPRRIAFTKGVLLPVPAFLALAAFGWSVVGTTSEWPLETFLGASLLTVAGIVGLSLREWNRSRWFAYGLLSSFFLGVLAAGVLVLLLMAAIGSAIKG
jgi:hypothetical protein